MLAMTTDAEVALESYERARAAVKEAHDRYMEAAFTAAKVLTTFMSIRDAAVLMGISHQRVYQLLHEKRR